MKIGIIGNYGATNVGDDAILSAILRLHRDVEWTVFSADPETTKKQFNVKAAPLFPCGFRSLFRHGFRRSLRALKSVDAVVLGGGGLFQDSRPVACVLWAWQLWWVRWFNKPLFVYATGVGPLKTRFGRFLTHLSYRDAQVITVRDEQSRALLRELGLTEGEIHVTADPSFLTPVQPIASDRKAHRFIISLRPWAGCDKIVLGTFAEFLLKLKEEKNAEFLFVPMQEIKEHDHKILGPLAQKTGGKIWSPGSFSELLSMLQTAEFAIGMRYHFLIACLLTGTPVIPISYGPKVDSLLADSPLERYRIKAENLSVPWLEENLKRLSVDYNNVRIYQGKRVNQLEESAQAGKKLFERFLADLKAGL